VADEYRNAESFEELAMPLFARLYNFAHWLTHDRTEAEDLVQETYM
jgi:RNA polymerase sigma-70 factor (ECF subfamily)